MNCPEWPEGAEWGRTRRETVRNAILETDGEKLAFKCEECCLK